MKSMMVRFDWGDKRGREFEVPSTPDSTPVVLAVAGALAQGHGCFVYFFDGQEVTEIYSIPPGHCTLEVWQAQPRAKGLKAAATYKLVFGESKINGVLRVEAQLIKEK